MNTITYNEVIRNCLTYELGIVYDPDYILEIISNTITRLNTDNIDKAFRNEELKDVALSMICAQIDNLFLENTELPVEELFPQTDDAVIEMIQAKFNNIQRKQFHTKWMIASPMTISNFQCSKSANFRPAVAGSFTGPNNHFLCGEINGIKV